MRKNVISKELVKSDMQFLLLLLIQLQVKNMNFTVVVDLTIHAKHGTWQKDKVKEYILFIRKCQEKSLEVDGIDMKKMTSATKSLTKNC